MPKFSPVKMFAMTQSEGVILKCKSLFVVCSYCFKEFAYNSQIVVFSTSESKYKCHPECEVELRNRIEKDYWNAVTKDREWEDTVDKMTKKKVKDVKRTN